MPALINWELLRQPYNWLIVALMLMVGSMALCLLIGNEGQTQLSSTPLNVV